MFTRFALFSFDEYVTYIHVSVQYLSSPKMMLKISSSASICAARAVLYGHWFSMRLFLYTPKVVNES